MNEGKPATVTLQPAGWRFAVPPGETVLRAAEAAGIELPSSCRNGTCRTCVCRLAGGKLHYLVEWPGLSADEQRAGWILPCVAVPDSDLVIAAPLARRPAHPGAHD